MAQKTYVTVASDDVGEDFDDLMAGLGLAGRSQSYIGPVSNGCFIPSTKNAGQTKQMSRTGHFLRENVNGEMYIEIPNWVVNVGAPLGDTGPGAAATVTASIEYPEGTIAAIATFGGNVQGTVPDGGTLRSDRLNVTAPRGAQIFVRIYRECSAGTIYTQSLTLDGAQMSPGKSHFYTTALATDLTQTAAPVYNSAGATNIWYGPCAILGPTKRATYAVIGDSRSFGAADRLSSKDRDTGNIVRSIGDRHAVLNLSVSSARLLDFNTSSAQRRYLAGLCSHIVLELGFNDLSTGAANVATIFGTALASLPAGKTVITATMEPQTTSTDSWVTTANQTISDATRNADRITENTRRRAGIAGVATCWEIADLVETNAAGALTRGGGYWGCLTASGIIGASGSALTPDGTHAGYAGNKLIQDSGNVRPSGFGI
ncbi:hypothetical protein PX699_00320 [Sphingobium sp. H39-3-25]|uniref:hypothetical protein n=1 Tax=Sphingobium arseniciresistens TaxID=3030834 RepID=UPI0023B8DB34|nr:hypothetical protein [Sphingobium arseniciresistens]